MSNTWTNFLAFRSIDLPDGTRADLGWISEGYVVGFRIVFDSNLGELVRIAGQIKWDGCADMQFRPNDGEFTGLGCLHWCGDSGFRAIVKSLAMVKREAYRMLDETR